MLSYSLENALMVAVFQLLIAGLIFCSSSAILYMQREARTFLSLVAAASFSYCLFSFLKAVILYRSLSASVGFLWPSERYFLLEALEKAALVLVSAAFIVSYSGKKPGKLVWILLACAFLLLIGMPFAVNTYNPSWSAGVSISPLLNGLWLVAVGAFVLRFRSHEQIMAGASLLLFAAAQFLGTLSPAATETANWLWTLATACSLAGLGLLALVVESRSSNLPLRFFLRLNLIFIAVASLLIAIVAEMERREYLSLTEQNAQELFEYLRGQVIYSSYQDLDPRKVLSSSEIVAKITADFARLADLRRVRVVYKDWGMEMEIGDDWLISHQVYRAAVQKQRRNRAEDRGRIATLTPVSIESKGKVLGSIEVDESLSTINSQVARHMRVIFLMFTAAVFIAAGLFGVTVQYAHRTIQQQFQALEATNTQLIHVERLASVGQLAGGFAHEINNPAGIILTTSDYLLREGERRVLPEDFQDGLQAIRRQAWRVSEIVNGLLTFSRPSKLQMRQVNVNTVLTQSLVLLAPRFRDQRVHVQQNFQVELPSVSADPDRLEQVFVNLLNNAADAMPDGGEVRVETRTSHRDGADNVLICIADSGIGIAEENLETIFDPFFSTKAKGKGTGLGLSVSHGIVRDHGGVIEAESSPGCGATFRLYLPIGGTLS